MKRISACALALSYAACSQPAHDTTRKAVVPAPVFGTAIVIPKVLRGLPLGADDVHGEPTFTPCTTCHGREDASALPTDASHIQGPHAGLRLAHGSLRCASCHEASHRDQLHLADGRSILLVDALVLCAQCHGPQKRDYDHGAHGGMRGYWDLSRGPRERNHCIACHDPHAPAFGSFMPMPGPRDRFAAQEESRHD